MKILLPVDQSTFSQEAIRTVASLVRPRRSEVRVLHVMEHATAYLSADLFPHFVKQTAIVEQDMQAESRILVSRAVGKLRRAGLKAKGVVEKGDASAVIINYAKNWGADLIVVGSHGLTGLKRVLMGSVSATILRDAKCSVHVVRVRRSKDATKRKPDPKGR